MAHFAKLDENNVVLQVVVLDNKHTSDANGVEKEHIGAAYLEMVLGGRWVQTSYNNNFRKRYAGQGYTYNEEHDAFIGPKPEEYPSFILDTERLDWVPPLPVPTETPEGKYWRWDEPSVSWVAEDLVTPE